MSMVLKRWFSALRECVRSFLGLDVLPTRSEIIALRDDLAKYHREVMDALNPHMPQPLADLMNQAVQSQFQAPTLDWETVQKLELFNMLQHPQKED